jgi:hypothetical protein
MKVKGGGQSTNAAAGNHHSHLCAPNNSAQSQKYSCIWPKLGMVHREYASILTKAINHLTFGGASFTAQGG